METSVANQDLAAQLAAVTQQLARMTATTQPAAPAAMACGLPAQQPMAFGLPAQQQPAPMMASGLQPIGVAVPVKIPLPDGSTVRMYVQFGPEAAANLQQTAMVAAQMFGQYLDAWQSRQQQWGGGGYGHGNGGGYSRGGYGRGRW